MHTLVCSTWKQVQDLTMKLVWYILLLSLALVPLFQGIEGKKDHDPTDDDWKDYKQKFKKEYKGDHEPKRRKNFEDKHRKIKKHNEKADKGEETYHMGHNHLSDLSDDEIVAQYTGFKIQPRNRTKPDASNRQKKQIETRQLPATIDWKGDRCMAPIRDQGSCSACYAFAAVSGLEFPLCKRLGSLVQLSEQQLIDCSGQQGCTSGHYIDSWYYAIVRPGMATRTGYPYAAQVATCKNTGINANYRPSTWVEIPQDETAMAYEIAYNGPIAVGFHAVSSFFNYKSGIYYDAQSTCDNTCSQANHAFTLVGYGTLNGYPYWIMRNSWTVNWGELGYAKIIRGYNMCNLACWPARAVV